MNLRKVKWHWMIAGLFLHAGAVVLLVLYVNGTGPFARKAANTDKQERDQKDSAKLNEIKTLTEPRVEKNSGNKKPIAESKKSNGPNVDPSNRDEAREFLQTTATRQTLEVIGIILRSPADSNVQETRAWLSAVAEKMLFVFIAQALDDGGANAVINAAIFDCVEIVPISLTINHIVIPLGQTGRLCGKYFVLRGNALKMAQQEADQILKPFRIRFPTTQACKVAVLRLLEEANNQKSYTVRYLLEVEGMLLLAKQGIIDDSLRLLDQIHDRFHLNLPGLAVQLFDGLHSAYHASTRKLILASLRKFVARLQDPRWRADHEIVYLLQMGRNICVADSTIAYANRVEFENDLKRVAIPLGKRLCFDVAEWEKGLPYLSYSDDAILAGIVRIELGEQSDEAIKLRLAREWTAWTKKATFSLPRRIAAYQRAIHWYDQFLNSSDDSSAVLIAKIEKDRVLREIQCIEDVKVVVPKVVVFWLAL